MCCTVFHHYSIMNNELGEGNISRKLELGVKSKELRAERKLITKNKGTRSCNEKIRAKA